MQMKALLPTDISALPLAEQVSVLMRSTPTLAGKLEAFCDLGNHTPTDAMLEVLKFMSLIDASYILSPSKRVDEAWHQFILHTLVYHEYCTKCYDKYLHHTPSNDTLENANQFEQTITLYREKYGNPPQWFWGLQWQVSISGDCSACELA